MSLRGHWPASLRRRNRAPESDLIYIPMQRRLVAGLWTRRGQLTRAGSLRGSLDQSRAYYLNPEVNGGFLVSVTQTVQLVSQTVGVTRLQIKTLPAGMREERLHPITYEQFTRYCIDLISCDLADSATVDYAMALFCRNKAVGGRSVQQSNHRSTDGRSNVHWSSVVGYEDRESRLH